MTARQLTLLNQSRARAKGPETSKQAAEAVAPAASELETLICQVVEAYRGYATAEAIARDIGAQFPGRWVEGGIRSAVSRAVANSLIEPCGTGLTSRGRSAVTYRRVRAS